MAKISAHGAHEVARIKATIPGNHYSQLFVIASDGRVLSRYTDISSGYRIYGRIKDPSKRTAEFLRVLLEKRGYHIAGQPYSNEN